VFYFGVSGVDFSIPWWQVDYGPEASKAVKECVDNKQFSMGSQVEAFELEIQKLLSAKLAVGVTSGSDALLISLISLGVKPGSKVLLQDRSWIAAANALAILGAIVILVDVDESGRLSVEDLICKYEKDVIGLIIVEMNGLAPDLESIVEFCIQRNIFFIEDAAQALGSDYLGKSIGTFGTVGCFSLSTAKIVGAGQGGFVVTNDEKLGQVLREVRLHGNKSVFEPTWNQLGFNFRLTDIHASIALTQLKKLEERRIAVRRVQEKYLDELRDLKIGKINTLNFTSGELGPYVEFFLEDANKRGPLISFMASKGFEVRPFYPSLIEAAKYMRVRGGCPTAKSICSRGVYLPSGPDLKLEEVLRVTNALIEFERSS